MSNQGQNNPYGPKRFQQQSLLSFLTKEPKENGQNTNRHNQYVQQNQQQQDEPNEYNPRKNNDRSRLFNGLMDFKYDTPEENNNRTMQQQKQNSINNYQIVNKSSGAQQTLDFFSGSGLPQNTSRLNEIMSQSKGQNSQNSQQQQPYHHIIDDYERNQNTDDDDDVIEIQDKGPYVRRGLDVMMQRQPSVEDIDDSIEFIDDGYKSSDFMRQKGMKPLSQIVPIVQRSNSNSNNVATTLNANQIFRPKSSLFPDNQSSSQDVFNFQSANSQQKSSQEIIQELEMHKIRDKSIQDRVNKLKYGNVMSNLDDIKLNSNRFQVDPSSLNKQRQQRIQELDQYKYPLKANGNTSDNKQQQQQQQQQSISSTAQLINSIQKNNIFVNQPIVKETSAPNKNKEILDKFSKGSNNKKSSISDYWGKGQTKNGGEEDIDDFEEDDNDDDDSDSSSGGNGSGSKKPTKKQKLNTGSSRQVISSLEAYNAILGAKTKNILKQKQMEKEKQEKIKQSFINKAKMEREKKLEEDSKLQRQKLANLKSIQVRKEKQKLYELQQKQKAREYMNTNFQQEYEKSTSLKAKQFLLQSIGKDQNLLGETNNQNDKANGVDGDKKQNDSNKQVADITAYDKEFEFLFDETENAEERKNFYSLIKFVFSQDYNKEDINRVDNKRIPNKFSSWKEYYTIFEYLFLMECVSNVQQVFQAYRSNENYRQPLTCYSKILNYKENPHGFFELQIYRNSPNALKEERETGELNTSEDDFYRLCTLKNHAVLISSDDEPDLSQLTSTDFKKKKSFLFFGWVVPPEGNSKDTLKIYADIDAKAYIKQFSSYDGNIPIKIFNFQKMTTFIREYLAIKNMRYNDLNRFIYNPHHIVETKTPISNPQCLLPLFEELRNKYNASQFQSIKEICLTSQGICMLQGPPGTGKTHTLLGLLSGLHYYIKKNPEHTKPKIMICAPSNTAVDEIVSRIIEYGLSAPGGQKVQVNVLRVGAIDYVPTENVKRACLEYQIERKMKELGMSDDKHKKQEGSETLVEKQIDVVKINQEIEKAKKELSGPELSSQLDYLFDKKRRLQSQISVLKLEKVARRDQIKNISDQLLGLADVVCCTLASSISEKLERFKNQVEVLVVDEAAQCTEPNNIIPLSYSPSKMVLIGDPKQLPATTFQPDSNVTKYNRSLFERIIDNNIKPYFLDQQYRMHPNIREFPSLQFYDNKLQDGVLVENRAFPNYLQKLEKCNTQFIDVVFSKERKVNNSYQNEMEGLAAISICNSLIDEIEKFKKAQPDSKENPSIGIITPYKQQTKLINEFIRQQIPKSFHKFIQVNTVDSFQGQEKDIIIFSTVRVNNKDQWRENMIGFLQDERRMNVALTRARFCLIVLGHSDTLNSDPIWGAFCDFMAKYKRYGKFRNKDQITDLGKMILKGSLLEGSSSVYQKKDWGDEYKEMLLKNNQVNDLKLTDFEPIEIEDNSGGLEEGNKNGENNKDSVDKNEHKSDEKPKPQESTAMETEELQQDQPIQKHRGEIVILSETVVIDKSQEKPLEIIQEPEDFDLQKSSKQKRTGITLQEALQIQQDQIQMNSIKGAGLGGLSALIASSGNNNKENQNKEKKNEEVSEIPEIVLVNKVEEPKKEDDELLKKIFFQQNKKPEATENNGADDIYEQIKKQRRENLLRQKKTYETLLEIESQTTSTPASANPNKSGASTSSSSSNQKSSSLSSITQAAMNQVKQKLQNNNGSDSAAGKSSLSLLTQITSSSSNTTNSTKPPPKGLGSLVGFGRGESTKQEDNQSQFPLQKSSKDLNASSGGGDIYEQMRQQKRENIQKKIESGEINYKNPANNKPSNSSSGSGNQNKGGYSSSSSYQNPSYQNKTYTPYNPDAPGNTNKSYSPTNSYSKSSQIPYSKSNYNFDYKQNNNSKQQEQPSMNNNSSNNNINGGMNKNSSSNKVKYMDGSQYVLNTIINPKSSSTTTSSSSSSSNKGGLGNLIKK